MVVRRIFRYIFAALIAIEATPTIAASSSTTELGFSYRYESLKSPTAVYAHHDIQGFYLKPFKAIWAGGEIVYGTHQNPSYGTKQLELGGLIKYWVMDPGQGFSFNLFSGLAFGREDNGVKSYSTMTIKAGPEFAYFVLDGVSVSTRVQYTSRKAGEPFTGIGIHSGLSLHY